MSRPAISHTHRVDKAVTARLALMIGHELVGFAKYRLRMCFDWGWQMSNYVYDDTWRVWKCVCVCVCVCVKGTVSEVD